MIFCVHSQAQRQTKFWLTPCHENQPLSCRKLTDPAIRCDSASVPMLVTGASGNLGGELARQLARSGVHLSLWGRDRERLEATAGACRARGAQVSLRLIDLADVAAAGAAFDAEDTATPFAVVLLVAGQGATLGPGDVIEDPAQVARQCHLNFTATAALAAQAAARMCARTGGKIGIIGSAAAAHALPLRRLMRPARLVLPALPMPCGLLQGRTRLRSRWRRRGLSQPIRRLAPALPARSKYRLTGRRGRSSRQCWQARPNGSCRAGSACSNGWTGRCHGGCAMACCHACRGPEA